MMLLEHSTPYKILLINDRRENIKILIEMLRELNIDFFVAFELSQTYKILNNNEIDLVIFDSINKNQTAYALCQTLKKEHQEIPFVLLSSLNSIENRLEAFLQGVDDYITKPLLNQEFLIRIKLHLQKIALLKSLKDLLRHSYHELYNPLTIIGTSLELQKLKYGSNKYIDAITVASRSLQVIYDDLYYSLSDKNHREKSVVIDLLRFIQKRVEYFFYMYESKGIDIDIECEESDFRIQMCEADILRLVDNTLSNAIKYASEKSSIEIQLSFYEEYIVFSTQNVGATIKNPEKIFNKGYRESFERIGLGIGLEIVNAICHINSIVPEVVSQNTRTKFTYKIPKYLE